MIRSTGRASDALARPRLSRRAALGLFLLPALVLYVLFVLFPIIQAAHFSLYKWNGLRPLTDFVGLGNYTRALADPIFQQGLLHNAIIVEHSDPTVGPEGIRQTAKFRARSSGGSGNQGLLLAVTNADATYDVN